MASPSTVHLIDFDIRTKEHIFEVPLRDCFFVSRKGAKGRVFKIDFRNVKDFSGLITSVTFPFNLRECEFG